MKKMDVQPSDVATAPTEEKPTPLPATKPVRVRSALKGGTGHCPIVT